MKNLIAAALFLSVSICSIAQGTQISIDFGRYQEFSSIEGDQNIQDLFIDQGTEGISLRVMGDWYTESGFGFSVGTHFNSLNFSARFKTRPDEGVGSRVDQTFRVTMPMLVAYRIPVIKDKLHIKLAAGPKPGVMSIYKPLPTEPHLTDEELPLFASQEEVEGVSASSFRYVSPAYLTFTGQVSIDYDITQNMGFTINVGGDKGLVNYLERDISVSFSESGVSQLTETFNGDAFRVNAGLYFKIG